MVEKPFQESTVFLMSSVEIVQGNHIFVFYLFHISGKRVKPLLLPCEIIPACMFSVSEEAALLHFKPIDFAAEVSLVASLDSKQHYM